MGYRPTTYCKGCGEAFDVYRAPEDRVCDACLETLAIEAEEAIEGSCPDCPPIGQPANDQRCAECPRRTAN